MHRVVHLEMFASKGKNVIGTRGYQRRQSLGATLTKDSKFSLFAAMKLHFIAPTHIP